MLTPRLARPRDQRGSSLIEILVAILVTSVGMLAMAGLLGVAARLAKTSEFRAEAALLANDMADRIRANLDPANLMTSVSNYTLMPTDLSTDPPETLLTCVDSEACTQAEIAQIDISTWQRLLRQKLPFGTGYIGVNSDAGSSSTKMIDLWVIWQEPDAMSGGSGATWGQYFNAADDVTKSCPSGFNEMTPLPRCLFIRVGL